MNRRLALVGLLLLAPFAAAAADLDVYGTFRGQVQKELSIGTDEIVLQFLQGVYRDRWQLSIDEIKGAIHGEVWTACGGGQGALQDRFECGRALENIPILAEEEQALRGFGRTLQRIAAGQELPISEIPGRPFHLATDLSGIINIWRAGTGSTQHVPDGAILIRTRPLDDDEKERIVGILEDANEDGIADMSLPDAIHGLVWRYQYGVRLVLGERNPRYRPPIEDDQSYEGTERQYLFKNWGPGSGGGTGWEQILKRVWDAVPKERDDFDPPLSENEAAYILFPDEVQDLMPEGTLLWARVDQAYRPGSGDDHPLGDVGIVWKYPIEPLLPSLLSIQEGKIGEPILGGRYPPEPAYAASSDEEGNPTQNGKAPIDGAGICSMALGQRGYLCRRISVASEDQCPDDDYSPGGENVITLVSCTLEEEPTLTVAGADVCEEITWQNDEDRSESESSSPGCSVPAGNLSEYELVKIQQRCIMETDDPYAGKSEEEQEALCCRLEGEAHLVACKAIAVDGVLRTGDENAPVIVDGIEVTPQVCMEIMRLKSCGDSLGREVRCPATSELLTADDADAIVDILNPDEDANRPNDPERSLRIAARVRAIERYKPACSPGAESSYKNTIGNNACYIGRCAEESLELHRLTGGRSPFTVSDSAFPWDDPNMGDALATTLRSIPATNPPLPSYRPLMVLHILEDALCQLQGLPPSTPPHLCAFSSSRRLGLPLAEGAATAKSIVFGAGEEEDAKELVRQIAAALGSRIGTDMQGQYLRIGTRTLSEVVALANSLLSDMLKVHFPTNMCPLSQPGTSA